MKLLLPFLALVFVLALTANGQISTPCTAAMLSTFTPCMNFLTNSTGSGSSPTADCCGSLRNLISNGMGCLCLIVTAGVPFQMPISPSLAISLPRACNMPGVPLQCKASSSAIPAPGPASQSPAASPEGLVVPEPTPSSEAPDTTPMLTPPSPIVGSETPAATPGGLPDLIPSADMASYTFSPSLLLFALGFIALKYY